MSRTLSIVCLNLALLLGLAASAPATEREAFTLWWVIFNQPENCFDGCGEDDLANPAAEPSVVYASGQVARLGGRVQLVASLYEQANGYVDEVIGGPGLLDAAGAEIHAIVRSHGPADLAIYKDQISQFVDPGCSDVGGPNTCVDIQFAVHPPDGGEIADVFWFPDFEGGSAVPGASSTLRREAGGVRVILETKVH